jgi:DNA-binding NarL/FixJ family response regulator
MAIKLIIYDDNFNLLNSIETMLQFQDKISVIATKTNCDNIIEDIAKYQPDVILMDIDMPRINGIEAVKTVRQSHTELPIIMFTVFDDNDNIFQSICAGANGYLLKTNFDVLPNAILDVTQGGAPMTSSIAKKVLSFVPKSNTTIDNSDLKLSARETEMLEYIAKGFSYKMIASELNISIETVRSHAKHIYKKLQVNSATGAAHKYYMSKK